MNFLKMMAMYKVLVNHKYHSFDTYSEALSFKQENGGVIYMKVCSVINSI